MKRLVLLLINSLFFIVQSSAHLNLQDSILRALDLHLEKSATYIEKKENKIHELRNATHSQQNEETLYRNYIALFEEYKSYKYDSAYYYANKSLLLAEKMKNRTFVIIAKTKLAFCLASSGLFKEAFDILQNVDDIANASTLARNSFYSIKSRIFYDLADYSQNSTFYQQYIEKGGIYTDSLLQVLPEPSAEYQYAIAQRQMKERQFEEALQAFCKLQQRTDIDMHNRAIVTSCLGWIYLSKNQEDEGIYYLAEAAINDISAGVKETTALCTLAKLLYQKGDIDRAVTYVHRALEDANFYNARHRKIEVGALLPIIEQERFDIVEGQRNTLITFVSLITLLCILLLAATFIIRKQMVKIRDARCLIEERNRELQNTNLQLSEANNIKDEYIGSTFYVNAEHINKMENLYKLVNRKITAKQYDDLKQMFNLSQLNKERENMYTDFDETFLKLFPNFVESYNLLFAPEDRTIPKAEMSLTSEMRIFALIRLGITKPENIAKFLNYSVNTINTYKTRIKNKSSVPNDLFETKIMEIGSFE